MGFTYSVKLRVNLVLFVPKDTTAHYCNAADRNDPCARHIGASHLRTLGPLCCRCRAPCVRRSNFNYTDEDMTMSVSRVSVSRLRKTGMVMPGVSSWSWSMESLGTFFLVFQMRLTFFFFVYLTRYLFYYSLPNEDHLFSGFPNQVEFL